MTELVQEGPEKFYKYRAITGESQRWVEKILFDDEIFFAPASSFNDPFDLRPVFSLEASPSRHREEYLRLSKKFEPNLSDAQREREVARVMETSLSASGIRETANAIQTIHSHHMTTAIGVFCVSTKRDDILMWAHYAEFHRGICLEFDGKMDLMASAQKVLYSQDRVPLNPYDDHKDVAMEKSLLTKSAHWSYEAEWRLIRYAHGPGAVKFRPNNLTGIIVGALATSSTVDLIKSWVKRRSAPLNLYRASVSGSKFELQITPYKNF